MTDKELRRLSRTELLEILLVQAKEIEQLRQELAETKEQLEDRRLRIEQAGNLADAVVAINDVMKAAQAAADQYLENIALMEAETKSQCMLLLRAAREEKRRIESGRTKTEEFEISEEIKAEIENDTRNIVDNEIKIVLE